MRVPGVHQYLRDEARLLGVGLALPVIVGQVQQLVGSVQPWVVVVHQRFLLLLKRSGKIK